MSATRDTVLALHLRQVTASYGQAVALRSIDLEVGQGEVIGVVGPNGAGKSTLLRTIARVHRTSTGDIDFFGESISHCKAEVAVRKGIALVREGGKVFEDLTVSEHLVLAGALAKRRGKEPLPKDEVMDLFPALGPLNETRAGYLSGGERQMLCLAVALTGRPKGLLLDEPSAGLAQQVALTVFQSLRTIVSRNIVCVIAEQDERFLDGVVDRSYLLEGGYARVQDYEKS